VNTRIGSLTFADATRASFDAAVTEHDLRQLAALPAVRTLQTAAPVPGAVWSLLNDVFFAARPDVELRVYGYYEHGMECDLAFAARLPNVRHFTTTLQLLQAHMTTAMNTARRPRSPHW
jgi:hypothetical protein